MQQRTCFMRIFLTLALFTIGFTFASLYILYSQNSDVQPSRSHVSGETQDIFACTHPKTFKILNLIDSITPLSSIFFHEITCQGGLRVREACSVESAARANPDRKVYVVFAKSLTITECTTGVLAELATLPNVNYYIMNLKTYADNTPINQVPLPRLVSLGNWNFAKIEEMINILTVYKFGGTVIDLDMMVVEPLDSLGEAWVSRKGESFESAIVSVAPGLSGKYYSHLFFNTLKRQIALDFGMTMESSVKEFLMAICNTSDVREMTQEKCKGLHVHSSQFFTSGNQSWLDLKATNDSYVGYYLWKTYAEPMPIDSLYAKLARRYCPRIYTQFMDVGNELGFIHL